MSSRTCLLLLIIVFVGCTSDKNSVEGNEVDYAALILEPNELIELYQSFIDSNRFEEAKLISTEAGKVWLDELAHIVLSDEEPDSTILNTKFLDIDCQSITQDSLRCYCIARDQDGAYDVSFIVVKENKYWRIDAPEDDEDYIEEQIIIDMLDDLKSN